MIPALRNGGAQPLGSLVPRDLEALRIFGFLEDLQWADVALVLLAHVSATIAKSPLRVVGTFRTGELLGPPLRDAMD
ncbi:MAG TPA: hypothetical protein VGO78_23755, partial [Acidimicrobiales bacterium]|nr:hypothetical protein [Acidimicrobiales bacterium]